MKPFWESKTLWFNVVSIVVLVAGILLDNAQVLALPAQAGAWLGVVVAIGNALLRLQTSQGLTAGREGE